MLGAGAARRGAGDASATRAKKRGTAAHAPSPSVRSVRDEVAEFREIFNLFDTVRGAGGRWQLPRAAPRASLTAGCRAQDGGGSVSTSELLHLLRTLGLKTAREDVELMVREVDVDGSGDIDFEGGRRPRRAAPRGG